MKKLVSLTLLVFLIFISIYAAGCSKPSVPEKQKPQTEEPKTQEPKTEVPKQNLSPADYFPLTLGSTWDYEGEGNEYAAFTREVIFVEGDRAQIREGNGGTVSASVFQTSTEAVTRIFFKGEEYDKDNFLNTEPKDKIVILKAPLQVGTKWDDPNGSREIVDIKARVETPAGIFEDCVKVKIATKDSTLYDYYKKDVGLVLREFTSGDTKVTSTLKKYSITK